VCPSPLRSGVERLGGYVSESITFRPRIEENKSLWGYINVGEATSRGKVPAEKRRISDAAGGRHHITDRSKAVQRS